MHGAATRAILSDVTIKDVTKVECEIRTLHRHNTSLLRHTVITLHLNGNELLATNSSNDQSVAAQSNLGDDVEAEEQELFQVRKMNPSHGTADQSKMSGATPKELKEFKRTIETKAEERLQERLAKYEKAHKINLNNARNNFRKLLDDSLYAVQMRRDEIADRKSTVRLPVRVFAELARHDSRLWKEYEDLCTKSLQDLQADLKRQYRERLDDIESECREWLQTYAGSNLNLGAVDGITSAITRAQEFEGRVPDVSRKNRTMITPEEIEAAKDERNGYFWEQAQKDIQDGGMAFRREHTQLEPLFDEDRETVASWSSSMVTVPAASLPMHEVIPQRSANHASADQSIIDRNNSTRAVQPTASSSQGESFQHQGAVPLRDFLTNNFTSINHSYVSPYPAPPASNTSQLGPTLIPSNAWYDPADRILADRTHASSVGNSTSLSTPASAAGHGSEKQIGSSSFGQKTSYPLAGTFTISQSIPRSNAPILLGPAREGDRGLHHGEAEIPCTPRPLSVVSKSNIISGPRRRVPALVDPNTYDESWYGEASEDEEYQVYVPPPASPDHKQFQSDQTTGSGIAPRQPARFNPNTYVDESLYNADQIPPPASMIPQHSRSQQYEHLKTEHPSQSRTNLLSIPSHPAAVPPSPWMKDALRRPFEDGSGDLPDYEPSEGGDLPDYEDVDAEADTSRFLGTGGGEGERERGVICISSDEDGRGNGSGDEGGRGGGGGTGTDDPHGPVSNYYAPEPEFERGGGYQNGLGQGGVDIDNSYSTRIHHPSSGPHVDLYVSEREPRPFGSQPQAQSQTQHSNRFTRDATISGIKTEHEQGPSNSIVRNDTRKNNAMSEKEKANFRRVAKNKTVKQVIQILMDEERKRKRGCDGGEDESARKRVWHGDGMAL
ncbi:hypothetical protein BKA65DRAFT_472260 [Rhexocercosporidium sp. MPI-PUGE-AT-0058]|nr:hypothetical protein BKA65DRAFT_472260 [Rhexocercosporidium sp. MPI-PUGE-AT-0058]